MDLQGFLQIGLLIGLWMLPSVLVALLLRLTPLYQLSQRSRHARLAIIAGSGLLCWGLTFELLMWLLAFILYRVGEFYFDTTLGTVPGITRANVGQYGLATTNELWLRQFVPASLRQPCLSANITVCQLADIATKTGSLNSMSAFLLLVSLVPVVVNLLLSWYLTRPRSPANQE